MKLLAFGLIVLVSAAGAHADASKCDSIRWIISSKAILAKAKCEAKAAKKDIAVDPECIAKVEQKLLDKWAKAAKKGDCAHTGDGSGMSTLVDQTVESLRVQIVPLISGPSGGTCCTVSQPDLGRACIYAEETECVSVGGTPVVDGWCNPDGSCSAVASAGNCCDGLTMLTGGTSCAGSTMIAALCSQAGGTLESNSVCTPTGCAAP
jgi:hypothetical protein